MSSGILRRLNFITALLFIVGLVSAAVAYSVNHLTAVKRKPSIGFTLVTKETTFPIFKGQLTSLETISRVTTRYERSDGTWKQVRTYYKSDGKSFREDVSFGIPGEGAFQLDQNRATLNFVSSMGPKEQTSYVTVTNDHLHPNFLKDDVVLGYDTHVLRFPDEDGGYVDIYRAPALNNRTVRRITVSNQGVSIEDAVQIKEGNPEDKIFDDLPMWHIRYERFQDKINAMEESGKPEVAEAMRQELKRQLEKDSKR